jgi:hypothetical protein
MEVAMIAPEKMLPASGALAEFIGREQVASLAEKALSLVREVFPQIQAIQLEVSRDPDEAAEWLVLGVTAAAPRSELSAAYREYIRRWVRETPPEKRHMVRLSYAGV